MSDEPGRQQGCAGLAVAFLVGSVVGGCLSNVLTTFSVQGAFRHRQYEEERDAVVPAIAKDPAFKAVDVSEESSGGVYISGYVRTDADKKRLQAIVTRAIGEQRAARVMGISVGPIPY
jgi:hypothetical protein